MSTLTGLKGLLLVGGKSARMGEDKANLSYTHLPEWQRLVELMEPFCDEVFLCQREGQIFNHPSQIIDAGNGPLAAISQADTEHPNNTWLIIACDLPLLDSDTLSQLVKQRDNSQLGTHFQSQVDKLPEPMCSIYESSFFPIIHQAVADGNYCPRSLIQQHGGKLIPLENPNALKNANTPAEKIEIETIMSGKQTTKNISLLYFAQLREIAKKDSEQRSTNATTPAGLFEEIKAEYQFPHKQKQLMVAINEDFAEWVTILKEGDEIVFIPPVAGG